MQINDVEFKIGADPELFVQRKDNKRFIRAGRVFSGTKEEPVWLNGTCQHQVDGMAVEINPRPSHNSFAFSYVVRNAVRRLNRDANYKYNARVVIKPTVEFDEEEWEDAPYRDKILGCDPDYNAWTMGLNEPPNADVTFRTGAGHVTMGWGDKFEVDDSFLQVCGTFTRMQDATNGVASILYDQDTKRRELYGKAGAFRPTSFGVEYRTLSNKWVKSLRLCEYVASRSFGVAKSLMNGVDFSSPEVESIINENKTDEAVAFLKHHKIPLPHKDDRMV